MPVGLSRSPQMRAPFKTTRRVEEVTTVSNAGSGCSTSLPENFASRAVNSGVVPQQPPTTETPIWMNSSMGAMKSPTLRE